MASASLPSIAILQSCLNSNYVGYIKDESPLNGYINFKNSAYNPVHQQIAFEPSKIVPGCYHIRCIYTNKYWTRKSSATGSPITATAKEQNPKEPIKAKDEAKSETEPEAEEKVLDWDSTLFKVAHSPADFISIKHISTGELLCVKQGNGDAKSDNDEEVGCLICVKEGSNTSINTKTGESQDLISSLTTLSSYNFRIIDLDNFVLLPKNVAFKADNGLYYECSSVRLGSRYMPVWPTAANNTIETCHMEVSHEPNGTMLIKNRSNNRYWEIDPPELSALQRWAIVFTFVAPEGTESNYKLCRLRAYRVGSNIVVLRMPELFPDRFLTRFSVFPSSDEFLFADGAQTPVPEAQMEVDELVRQRRIDNVQFRIDDARIFNEEVIHIRRAQYRNNNPDPNSKPQAHNYSFSETVRTVSRWTAHLGLNLGMNVRIRAGIPFLMSARIEIGAEFEASYTWGEETEVIREVTESGTVYAPPMTMVRVEFIAKRAQYEVPFSYRQEDILLNWERSQHNLDNGNYIGADFYDFDISVTYHPL